MAIETILIAVGPSDVERIGRLAEEAIDVAKPTGARVVLGHVFTQSEYEDTLERLEFDRDREEVTPDDVARRLATIRDLGELLEEAGVDHEIQGYIGEHGQAIVSLAESVDADRVVVGGRRRSPTGKAVFGSVAQEVMLSAPCPVTFVRGDISE